MPETHRSEPSLPPNRMMLRRALFLLIVCGIVAFIVVALRLFILQIWQHDFYESAALEQQLRETRLPAARGAITDREGEILALSATTYTVYLSPAEIRMYEEDPQLIASGLSEILGVEQGKLLELAGDTRSWYKTVARKVDDDTADAVRRFKTENDLNGVKIETDTKRFYPFSSLAAHVIGFVGIDNTGLAGVEYSFNKLLTGTDGSVQRLKNSAGADMLLTGYERWQDAEDGASLALTLDVTAQYYLEKHLRQAVVDYGVSNGAAGIAVDPRTGAVLALASLGSFDLNHYQQVDEDIQRLADSCATEEERNALIALSQQRQWRNKAISDTYEPGSTFKILTLAMALEEGLVDDHASFYCGGTSTIPGRGKPLRCWKSVGHGSQTLTQAVQHSCNVAFANIGLRVGEETFYRYCEAFGLFDAAADSAQPLTGKTGIDLPGESGSIWWSRDIFCNPQNLSQLAAASFGQTFNITPIQLIMAVSACCNGGKLMKPYIVDSVTAPDGTVTVTKPETVRQVLSRATSDKVNAILEQVVCDTKEGTGKNAYVAGYRIAGKTGTSEKVAQDVSGGSKEYIVSFIGYAPADDPKVAVLILLDTPANDCGIYISGGQMAAPVVGRILADMLPALGVAPSYRVEEAEAMDKTVPDLLGLTAQEAAQLLKSAGLACRVVGGGERITAQLPLSGCTVAAGTTVLLSSEGALPQGETTVPDLTGMSYEAARDVLAERGLFLRAESGLLPNGEKIYISAQSLPAGFTAQRGEVLHVALLSRDEGNYGRY